MTTVVGSTQEWLDEVLRSDTDACLLWPFRASLPSGYGQVRRGGRTRLVTHLVLEASGRPRPHTPADHALHSCPGGGDPRCCNPRHLRWGTNRENIADKITAGHQHRPTGSSSPTSKLTDEQVREIRRRHVPGKRGYHGDSNTSALAAEYGVSPGAIRNIVRRITWGHLW